MKSFLLSCICGFVLHFGVAGQFTDQFDDGDLNGWLGNPENFIVNASGQLQLNAPSGSTNSWLYVPVTFQDSMVWEMYFKMDFAPSTSNQLRIYLGLTSPDLATAQGYYLEIGASGDVDALDLKYLDAGAVTLIASSEPGYVAAEPVDLTIRVVRDSHGIWSVYNISGAQPEFLFSGMHALTPLCGIL